MVNGFSEQETLPVEQFDVRLAEELEDREEFIKWSVSAGGGCSTNGVCGGGSTVTGTF